MTSCTITLLDNKNARAFLLHHIEKIIDMLLVSPAKVQQTFSDMFLTRTFERNARNVIRLTSSLLYTPQQLRPTEVYQCWLRHDSSSLQKTEK